jgi:CRISPR system Cascade subunit CasC
MFLTQADIDAVINVLKAAAQGQSPTQFEKLKTTELQKSAISKGFRPIAVDVALFGRMVTDEAIRDVDASCQVAHAISTHRIEQEFDFFTAVDDLQGQDEAEREEDAGADMMGDIEYNSACYYKYFSIDLDGLVDNLVGRNIRKEVPDEEVTSARDIASKAVSAMLEAAAMVTPSGKQNTFASHTLPAAILVEVRPVKTPISYANAFADPVQPNRRAGKLVDGSLEQFRAHVDTLTTTFGLKTTERLWFAPFHPNASIPGTERVDTFPKLLERLQGILRG